jgi:thiol-disulfide isomerase/thioredoxin
MNDDNPGTTRREAVRRLVGLPLAGAAAAVWAGGSSPGPKGVPLPRLGDRLVLPDAELLDGSRFKAGQAAGQVVVLYWWASWCPFCAAQTPEVQKLWDNHRDRGLTVLGISIDARLEDAKAYVRKRRYCFPSTWNTPELQRALPKPGKGVPVICVLGRDGRVVMAEEGQLFPEDIEQIARFLQS